MPLFCPTLFRERITAITPEDLRSLGASLLLLDVDNTLTPHYDQALDPEVQAWLDAMRREGFRFSLVSNSREERVRPFAEKIGLPYQASSAKPLTGGFRRAAAREGVSPKQCVVIGDQIFTDVVGANWFGAPSILLTPISLESEKDQTFIRFKRWLERPILKRCRRKREETAK